MPSGIRVAPVPTQLVQTMGIRQNSCFPSGSLDLWHMLGRASLYDEPVIGTLGHWFSNETLVLLDLFPWCHHLMLEEWCPCGNSTGRGLLPACTIFFPSTSLPTPFPGLILFCIHSLYSVPSLTTTTHWILGVVANEWPWCGMESHWNNCIIYMKLLWLGWMCYVELQAGPFTEYLALNLFLLISALKIPLLLDLFE